MTCFKKIGHCKEQIWISPLVPEVVITNIRQKLINNETIISFRTAFEMKNVYNELLLYTF